MKTRRRPLPRLVRRGRRAARGRARRRAPCSLWHGDRDLQGVDAVDRPRRLLLRRLPARRRDRALLAGHGVGHRLRARRRPRARHLQRLPGPVRGGPAARRAAAQRPTCASSAARSSSRSSTRDTPFTRACPPGERLSIPAKHTTGRYYAPPAMLERLEAAGQVVLRYADGQQPQRLAARHRRRAQRRGQRLRADAPSRARRRRADRRSADGLTIFRSMAEAVDARVAA